MDYTGGSDGGGNERAVVFGWADDTPAQARIFSVWRWEAYFRGNDHRWCWGLTEDRAQDGGDRIALSGVITDLGEIDEEKHDRR